MGVDVPHARVKGRETGLMMRLFGAITVAVLLVAAYPALRAAAAELFSVAITPEIPGNTAVKSGQRVEVNGAAPAGSVITSARFLALNDEGGVVATEPVPDIDLNRSGVELGDQTNDFIRVNEFGDLEGQLTLRCTFSDPNNGPASCTPPGVSSAALEVFFEGEEESFRSTGVPVDYTRPEILSYELVDVDTIQVTFDEPVRMPDGQPEMGSDFTVTSPSASVSSVSGSGDTRLLTLNSPINEDATPTVTYLVTAIPDRTGYHDFASNRHHASNFTDAAADLVRPAAPAIAAVNGTAPSGGTVVGNAATPTLGLSNMTAGHEALVTVTGENFSDSFSQAVDSATPEITLPTLASGTTDAQFTISVAARDIHGNRSDDDLAAPRADGSPTTVTYRLDTVAPSITGVARQLTSTTVEVRLSEDVAPAGNAGEWTVAGLPATASGSGNTRTLSVSQAVPADATVAWQPTTTTYRDTAGNELTARQGIGVDLLGPLAKPSIATPANVRYVRADKFPVTIAGKAVPGTTVELSEPAAGGRIVATATADSSGAWLATLAKSSFPADGRYAFAATTFDAATARRSDAVTVPDIVVDTAAPSVTVHEPATQLPSLDDGDTRPTFLLGDEVTIAYTASDPATTDTQDSDHGKRVVVAVVAGDYRRVFASSAPYAPGERKTATYRADARDLGSLDVREVRFQVTTIDDAGNRTAKLSAPIRLVRPQDAIRYVPVRVRDAAGERAYIDLRFPVAVSGDTSALDWRVDGQLPLQASRVGDYVVRLTVVPSDADYDPNLRPVVAYQPALQLSRLRLQTDGGGVREVVRTDVVSRDLIKPVLFATPSARGPMQALSVTVSGTTDETSKPNLLRITRLNSKGIVRSVKVLRADAAGAYSLLRGLARDQANRFRVQAFDPSGNASVVRAFTVINDRTAPKVAVTAPEDRASISRSSVAISWVTSDRHFDRVRISYRVGSGDVYEIAERTKTKGTILWNPPDSRVLSGSRVHIRVVSVDRAGNSRMDSANHLIAR